MKFALYSDLHTEFDREDNMWLPPSDLDADVALFAGDIVISPRHLNLYSHLVENKLPHVKQFLYVAGNHEWYGRDSRFGMYGYDQYRNELEACTRSTFLEKETITIGDIVIVGCTLWTNMEDTVSACSHERLNDYDRIRIDHVPYRKVRPMDISKAWRASVTFLKDCSQRFDPAKTIVLTHHSPTRRAIHAPHGDETLMHAYASNLDDLIKEWQPAYWVHGHVHEDLDRRIGVTRLVCNPRGYNTPNHEDLVAAFNPSLVLTIN